MDPQLAPQVMLFGIAMDLALLGIIYMRLSKDYYRIFLLSMVLVLGIGALMGLIKTAYHSQRVGSVLPIFELLLPYVFWLQLGRMVHYRHVHLLPIPFMVIMGVFAITNGWGFQSQAFLVYELVFFLAQVLLLVATSARDTFVEGEVIFMMGAIASLMVFGPGYGLLWSDLEIHSTFFALFQGLAGAVVIVGRSRSSALHYYIPVSRHGRSGLDPVLPPGAYWVPLEHMKMVEEKMVEDIKKGRHALFISMEPSALVNSRLHRGTKADDGTGCFYISHLTHSHFSENALDPSDTDMLLRSVSEFLKRTRSGTVLLRDGHYLVSNTDIWEVGEVIRFLLTKVVTKDATILLGTDLLEPWEVEHLEKVGMGKWGGGEKDGKSTGPRMGPSSKGRPLSSPSYR